MGYDESIVVIADDYLRARRRAEPLPASENFLPVKALVLEHHVKRDNAELVSEGQSGRQSERNVDGNDVSQATMDSTWLTTQDCTSNPHFNSSISAKDSPSRTCQQKLSISLDRARKIPDEDSSTPTSNPSVGSSFTGLESSEEERSGILVHSSNLPRQIITENVMMWFRHWLDSRLELLARQCNGQDGSSGRTRGGLSEDSGSRGTIQGTKRVRDADSDGSDDGCGERGSRDGKGKRVTQPVAGHIVRLACPYFKHNPPKYQQWRTCPGPGWETVHRVK